jgi:hypothetical protein
MKQASPLPSLSILRLEYIENELIKSYTLTPMLLHSVYLALLPVILRADKLK